MLLFSVRGLFLDAIGLSYLCFIDRMIGVSYRITLYWLHNVVCYAIIYIKCYLSTLRQWRGKWQGWVWVRIAYS